MKCKSLLYLGALSATLGTVQMVQVQADSLEAKDTVIQSTVNEESSLSLSAVLLENQAKLTIDSGADKANSVTAKVWTQSDKSDLQDLAFEKDEEGKWTLLLPEKQSSAAVQNYYVAITSATADGLEDSFNVYQLTWSSEDEADTNSSTSASSSSSENSNSSLPSSSVAPSTSDSQSSITTAGATNEKVAAASSFSVANINYQAGTFDVIVKVTDSSSLKAVKVPVWTEENGQDDIKWYTATKQSDGTYKVTVSKKNHKNGTGTYNVHLYFDYTDGSSKGIASTKTSLSTKASGTLTIKNVNSQAGTYDVIISNVSAPKEIAEVKVPVWTDENGQDDIKWYTATKQSDGTYKLTINKSSHKNGTGLYHVHLYYKYKDGTQTGLTSATTTLVTKPSGTLTATNHDAVKGSFDVYVSDISAPKEVKEVKIPVWTDENGQDDIKWYTATKQSDGRYKITVQSKDHKNGTGLYHVHLYYTYKDGKTQGVTSTKTTLPDLSAKPSGKITITNINNKVGKFDVVVSDLNVPKGIQTVKVPVWSEVDGQDDISWYTASKQSDGTYKVSVSASSHKYSTGSYQAHLYVTQSDGKQVGLASTKANISITETKPQAQIAIKNVNNTYGIFDVVVSNIYSPSGIKSVKVPVWSEVNGQNDIRWYEAEKQSDGTYKVTVRLANHRYETGSYQAHLYITTGDGVQYGVTSTKANVSYTKKAGQAFIDVSSHNGTLTVADYRNLLNQGVTGVVVKLTEGTSYINPYAASQIKNAQAVGLKVSAYHYSHFTDAASARAEAQYFVKAAKSFGLSGSTVMVNDIEEPSTKTSAINSNMKAWEAEMKRLGYSNLVHYAGASWLDSNNLNINGPISTGSFGMSNFWVAQYPYYNGMSADAARNMAMYASAAAWQFTSVAKLLSGHSNFDLSIDYTGRFTNPNLSN